MKQFKAILNTYSTLLLFSFFINPELIVYLSQSEIDCSRK